MLAVFAQVSAGIDSSYLCEIPTNSWVQGSTSNPV